MCRVGRSFFLALLSGLAACAVVIFGLTACGTLDNFAQTDSPMRPFGGVRNDLKDLQSGTEDGRIIPLSALDRFYSATDLPLSAVGDTLTLPITVPHAAREWWRIRNAEPIPQPHESD